MADASFDLDFYTAALNASRDAIIIQDGVRFLDCNQAAVALFKYPRKTDLLRAHPGDFSPPMQSDGRKSRVAAEQQIFRAIEEGTHQFEWTHRDRDGRDFHCEVSLATFTWHGRELIRATIREVASRNQSVRRTAEIDRACFKALFDTTPVGIAIVDNYDAIVDANPGFEQLFQYSNDELLGRNLNDCIVPDAFRAEADKVSERASNGESSGVENTKRIRKDGSAARVSFLSAPVVLDGETIGACGIYRDMTPQWEARERLRLSEARLRAVIGHLPILLFTLDTEGVWTLSEGMGLTLLGRKPGEMVGRSVFDAYPDMPGLHEHFQAALNGESRKTTYTFSNAIFEIQLLPLTDGDNGTIGVIGLGRDVSEARNVERRLAHMALHDELTGLPNRTLLHDRVEEAMGRAHRKRLPFAMLFLDLDHFKNINDSLGHAVGDKVLKTVAGRFTSVLRETDTVARLGGDEFAILLEEVQEPHRVAMVARKLLEVLAATIPEKGIPLIVSASIGISLYPNDGSDADTLLRNADAAMYVAKETRNNYRFFAPEMNEQALKALMLSNNLRAGLNRGEFVLHYQPLMDLQSETLIGFEALVRWNHPQRGLIPPKDFIPLAEEMGLIMPLGEWIIDTASRQLRAWQEQGHDELWMAINLSSKQFKNWHFVERVGTLLGEAGVAPDKLLLELTESMLFPHLEQTREIVEKFTDMRIAIALDDCGTGGLPLDRLRDFPIDYLKVDRSFIGRLPADKTARATTTDVIETAKNLGFKVIAEGVETAGQLAFLRDNDCDGAQGFYFSKPLPAEAADQLLNTGGQPRATK